MSNEAAERNVFRWVGNVAADDIQGQDTSHQLAGISLSYLRTIEPIELADGTKFRDNGHVVMQLAPIEELSTLEEPETVYGVHLTSEDALRLAFLLQRAAGFIEDDREWAE